MFLSGCGSAVLGSLTVSPGTVSFGAVPVGQSAVDAVTLTNEGTAAIRVVDMNAGNGAFSVTGAALPITINGGASATVQIAFSPTTTGGAAGELIVNTDEANAAGMTVALNGTGTQAPAPATPGLLGGLSCSNAAMTGAGTDHCTVTLTAPAGSGGLTVNLSSSSAAVTVPATVTVPANATSATFAASISAVNSAHTVTVTASASGVAVSTSLELNAAASALNPSAAALTFGTVSVYTSVQQTVTLTSGGVEPVTVTAATIGGAGFSYSGPALPVVLNPGQEMVLTVTFDPTSAVSATGQLIVSSNASGSGTLAIDLSGAGSSATPADPAGSALAGLTCNTSSTGGPATVGCTVSLASAAPAGGMAVAVSSSNAAVATPTTVMIPEGSRSSLFTVSVSAVTSSQTAVLTAAANGVTAAFPIQVNASGPLLSVNAASVAFGDVGLKRSSTQSVILAAVGTQPVTVNTITITGTGFSLASMALPLTLNPGQTASLEISFDPAVDGPATGQVTITSNASNASSEMIGLSGTGATAYEVNLAWNAPAASKDPTAGYNIYRSEDGGGFELLNAVVDVSASFADSSVQNGVSYTYYVTSVDSAGNESAPSNSWSATIPLS